MDNSSSRKHACSESADHTIVKKRATTTDNVLINEESSSMSNQLAGSSQRNTPATGIPVAFVSSGHYEMMAPAFLEAFNQDLEVIRQIKACTCLSSDQNVKEEEYSNTAELLILVLDAFGYSAEEIHCRKQLSSFTEIFKKIFMVGDATIEFNITGSASQGFTNSLYSVSYQSDVDYVTINSKFKVITNQEHEVYKKCPSLFNNKNGKQTVLRVEEDTQFPGYVKLVHVFPVVTAAGMVFPPTKHYFSSHEYRIKHETSFKPIEQVWEGTNGPARTTHWSYPHPGSSLKIKTDYVPCLEYKTWPKVVHKWEKRLRPNGWPPKDIIQKIKHEGCYVAPVGHFDSQSKNLQWRLSFCGEKLLFSSLQPVQFYCFVALRLILKGDISRIDEDVLSSFHMKNVVYWCTEQSSCAWEISNFESCLKTCIKALIKFVSERKFPNYFIVGRNLLNSKMTSDISSKIVKLLQKYSDNIYEILSLDSLKFLKDSTLYKPQALELAVQKSVIHSCIVAYSQIVSIVVAFHFNIWNISSSIDVFKYLKMANRINNDLKSQKQHFFRRHILRSYIHSLLGFLNYACYKTSDQKEQLSVARKHVIKSMTFSNISLMCRAATFFFMELDSENCLKICNGFLKYPVTPQFLHQHVFQFSRNVCQASFDLIDESDIVLLNDRKKQLMSMFFCPGSQTCCEFGNSGGNILATFEKLTYIIFKDMYFHVIYTRVEVKALPDVIKYELHSLSKQSMESFQPIKGIYVSPFLNCCLLVFLCHHENRNFEFRDEVLNKIDEYYIKCKNNTVYHYIVPGINLHQEPVYQIANIEAYCHLKAKHYSKASKFILESMAYFPSKRNAACGYIRCAIQSLTNV